ncbi:MAG: hypothetical protein WD492_12985 [Alkalispirochaeta sp.]
MKWEAGCNYDGRSRLPRLRWLCVLALVLALVGTCGGPAYAQSAAKPKSTESSLDTLKLGLLTLDEIFAKLESQSESWQTRLDEAYLTLGTVASSYANSSRLWTDSLKSAEAEIRYQTQRAQRAERRSRRRLVGGVITTILAFIGGLAL